PRLRLPAPAAAPAARRARRQPGLAAHPPGSRPVPICPDPGRCRAAALISSNNRPMPRCHVYLVPGFFGFTSLGALNYFRRVGETLAGALVDRDCDVQVVECATQPTGSLCRRAQRVIDRVVETGGLEADSLHFVGHSTGGL